jgi:hypothetical protein
MAFNDNKLLAEDAYIYNRTDNNNDGIAEIDYTTVVSYGGLNKEPIIPAPKPVVLDPEDKALQDLEHLRVAGLWKKGMVKEYHTQLTDILRSYMENKLGICAIEMTSDQILDSYSEKTNMPDGTMEKLQSILRTADMVKFAKSEPMPNEHERSMNYAISFVQETANRLKELALAASKKTDITTNNNG